jgi:hypothetical protein
MTGFRPLQSILLRLRNDGFGQYRQFEGTMSSSAYLRWADLPRPIALREAPQASIRAPRPCGR